jgi:2-dehydro-3-deoxyphosphogluconate aldolase / (4S)-4-hydroxy-2-oxoglutarate aldolase
MVRDELEESAVKRGEVCEAIRAEQVIGVIRTDGAKEAVSLGEAMIAAGLRIVEVALTTPHGLEAISELASRDDGRLVGAGTVLDGQAALAAARAGAVFLVAPCVASEMIRVGQQQGCAVLPGAMTPTEIAHALELGADMVKIFPAGDLGAGFIRSVRTVFPHAPLVPTGGITAENAGAFLDAGADALGTGRSLTSEGPGSARLRAGEMLEAIRSRR